MQHSYKDYSVLIPHDLVFIFEHSGHVYGLFFPSLQVLLNNSYQPVIKTTEYTFISVFLLPVLLNQHNDSAITIMSYLNSYNETIHKSPITLLIKIYLDTKNPIASDMTPLFLKYYNLKDA